MRKPTGSARKTDRPRGAAVVARPPKKETRVRAAKTTPRRGGESRAQAGRNGRAVEGRATEKVVRGKLPAGKDAATGTSRGKYVYCIIEAGDPLRFGPVGI